MPRTNEGGAPKVAALILPVPIPFPLSSHTYLNYGRPERDSECLVSRLCTLCGLFDGGVEAKRGSEGGQGASTEESPQSVLAWHKTRTKLQKKLVVEGVRDNELAEKE